MELSERQIESIAEILTIGIGNAARSLEELTGDRVAVELPLIAMRSIGEVLNWIRVCGLESAPSAVIEFHGRLTGSLALLFPVASANELATALGMAELRDTVEETANILLNAVAGTIANCVQCELGFDLPRYGEGPILTRDVDQCVLFARTRFQLAQLTVEGQILLQLDAESTVALATALEVMAT